MIKFHSLCPYWLIMGFKGSQDAVISPSYPVHTTATTRIKRWRAAPTFHIQAATCPTKHAHRYETLEWPRLCTNRRLVADRFQKKYQRKHEPDDECARTFGWVFMSIATLRPHIDDGGVYTHGRQAGKRVTLGNLQSFVTSGQMK